MKLKRKVSGVLSALWMAGLWPAAADAEVAIMAHRAAYDLTFKRAEERSGIEGAQGRMVVEVTGSDCEGWTIDFRIVNQFLLGGGRSRLVDSRSSSWESGDGSAMRYSHRQYVDNRLEQDTMVRAERGPNDEAGKGEISKPKPLTFTLPAGALFPVVHQKHIIEAAQAGEARDRSVVFDGSDETKSFAAISFIGPRKEPEPGAPSIAGNGAKLLSSAPYWPVTISYFPAEAGKGEETPSHQISFRMYDNGVSGDLTLDYGEFALTGKLTNLDLIDQPKCK